MHTEYPATYTDARGTEHIVIKNDGKSLHTTIRGIKFEGRTWTNLEPSEQLDYDKIQQLFNLTECKDRFGNEWKELTERVIETAIPVQIVCEGDLLTTVLSVRYELSSTYKSDNIGPEIGMTINNKTYRASGADTFEYALLMLQRQLPTEVFFKCCWGCAFSSYNPYGDSDWGMFCFRNNKSEYLRSGENVKKFVLNHGSIEHVQEIYVCDEFERWDGKSGYRDPLAPSRRSP